MKLGPRPVHIMIGCLTLGSTVCLLLFLCRFFAQAEHHELRAATRALSRDMSQTLLTTDTLGLVQGLGLANPELKAVLQDDLAVSDQLKREFEMIRASCDASSVYAMDLKGDVKVSTVTSRNQSLLGNNYAFRPFFKEAVAGRGSVMVGVQTATEERGIFYAAPVLRCSVKSKESCVIGVVVIKMGFEQIDRFVASIESNDAHFAAGDGTIYSSTSVWLLFESIEEHLTAPSWHAGSVLGIPVARVNGDLHGVWGESFKIGAEPWRLILHHRVRDWIPGRLVAFICGINAVLWVVIALALRTARQRRRAIQRAQAAIAESAETYQTIFDASNDVIFVHDIETGEVVDWNEQFSVVFGYEIPKGEKVDMSAICEGTPPYDIDGVRERVAEAVTKGHISFDWRGRRKNGEAFWAEVHLRRAHVGGMERVLSTIRDISERKGQEEHLKALNRELQILYDQLKENQDQLLRAERMAGVGHLAAGMAHEINNPIGFVRSNINTLGTYFRTLRQLLALHEKLETEKDPARQQALLQQIEELHEDEDLNFVYGDIDHLLADSDSGIERVGAIVADLRRFAQLDHADVQTVSINECVRAAVQTLTAELDGCNIRVELGEVPCSTCNPSAINQLIGEIIRNAGEAGSHEVHVRTWSDGASVFVAVRDDGSGIAIADKSKLFDPFYTTKDVGKGTGMGLAVVDGVTREHGGRVEISSTPGDGTTVIVELPLEGNVNG